MDLRPAAESDVPWLLDELRQFDASLGLHYPMVTPANEAYAAGYLKGLMEKHYLEVACDPKGGRVGFLGALNVPHFFNPAYRMAAETFWWVSPEHRGGRAGAALLLSYRDWCKKNVQLATVSLEHNSQVNETTLSKRGFKAHERSFLMEVA